MRIKKDAVPACLSDHRCFMRLISPFRGLSYFSALLIILSNSAANSQPAFIPSYNPLGYSQTPRLVLRRIHLSVQHLVSSFQHLAWMGIAITELEAAITVLQGKVYWEVIG